MAFIAIIVILVVVHVVGLSSTIYRFQHRCSQRIQFWRDDAFAVLTTIGDLFMLGLLVSNVKQGYMAPFQYRLSLAAYFFVIWMSRATLVMTLVRICMQSAALRNKAVFFMSCTFVLVITGIVYIIVSILFCKTNDRNCVGFDVCFCRLPIQIAVSAMIVDSNVDICTIYTSRALIYGDGDPPMYPRDLSRKQFLMMGFSSSFLTLAMNSAFWITYCFAAPGSYFLYMSMANAVAAISVLTFNIPLIAGILLDLVYPQSPLLSYLDMPSTDISEHTVADFTPPNSDIPCI